MQQSDFIQENSKVGASSYLFVFSLIMIPILFLVREIFLTSGSQDDWNFIVQNMLGDLSLNTFKLLSLNLIFTVLFALALVILLELTDIPFKKIWNFLALIPLAVPLYVMAFIYVGLFEFSAPIPTWLREMGIPFLGALKIKSTIGVSFVLSLCLFPYVFLPLKLGLRTIHPNYIYSSFSLGASRLKTFKTLVLPRIFPSLIPGFFVVALETLADFGAVSVFNYETFTTAIFTAWSGFFSLTLAAKLSLILIAFIFFLLWLERNTVKEDRLGSLSYDSPSLFVLNPWWKSVGLFYLILFFFFSFFLPMGQLAYWGIKSFQPSFLMELFSLLGNTFLLGLLSCLLILVASLVLIFLKKNSLSFLKTPILIGYGVPGNVFAVAFLILGGLLGLNGTYYGSLLLLTLGLFGRFIPISFKNIEVSDFRISKTLEMASRSLGQNRKKFFSNVWLPQVSGALSISSLLVLMEVCKEMPLTLMLRPVGLNTLATKIYEFTSEGEWERAAIPAFILILLGLLNVFLLMQKDNKRA